MAGESARESARREREKAARLQRSAELWERGADRERATAAADATFRRAAGPPAARVVRPTAPPRGPRQLSRLARR